jgi:P-type E1-E2 ATPase
VGNLKLIDELGLTFDKKELTNFTLQGKTPVVLATKKEVLGFVTVSDEIKGESKKAIADLHKLGVKVIMLTGDDEKTAKHIASLVGIDDVVSNVLPEDKLNKIKSLHAMVII